MPVMVLAAGLGTRLRPLTDERPKPLVFVGDRPAIFHVLDRVRGLGTVVVNAFHFADELRAALAGEDGVIVSHERELLGTAGGVAFAAPRLGVGDVLVWNADVLADLDPQALLRAHASSGADATLAVRPCAGGAGNVGLDAEGRVVRLRRETFAPGEVRSGEFLGVHVLGAALRDALPASGCLVGDVYIPAGRLGARLRAHETDASFVDIGSLGSYLEANFAWRARHAGALRAYAPPPGVELGPDVVLGEGVRLRGQGLVDRVVAWPGAVVEAPLADAVVTPHRVVHVRGT